MPEITFNDKTFQVTDDGFLADYSAWDEDWVEYIRNKENISAITDNHKKVIEYLRKFYFENGLAPMIRILTKNTGLKLKDIYELFPSGPAKGACLMAGLPKPAGCV